MEAKIWKGSGLVFDIDAGDLKLDCQKAHSSRWVCGKCLEGAKMEAEKLINDFLAQDFGFTEKEMSVNFSGNRGYHIHVSSESVFALGSEERASISNYIKGTGIEISTFFPTINRRGVRLVGPKPTDSGWGGKLANGVIRAINAGTQELESMGIERKYANILVKKKADVILGITTGNWDMIEIPKKAEFWSNVLSGISVRQGDAIDKNVTTGIYHLIRLPGTIHGDTGLVAKGIMPLKGLESFDPMSEAVVFDDSRMTVMVHDAPRFAMNGCDFGPYRDERVSLPAYAGLYLVLKGFATLP